LSFRPKHGFHKCAECLSGQLLSNAVDDNKRLLSLLSGRPNAAGQSHQPIQ
jgi:hypothetical protein